MAVLALYHRQEKYIVKHTVTLSHSRAACFAGVLHLLPHCLGIFFYYRGIYEWNDMRKGDFLFFVIYILKALKLCASRISSFMM